MSKSIPRLGQVGDNQGQVVAYLSLLAQESWQQSSDWCRMVELNRTIYTYGADHIPDQDEVIANEIQNHVISSVDIQTREGVGVSLDPVETGEPADVYWAGPQDVGITNLQLMTEEVAAWTDPKSGETHPPIPVDGQRGEQLVQMVASGMLPEKYVVELNDRLVAEMYQGYFDLFWKRSRCDGFVVKNVRWTCIDGFAWALYEWDDADLVHKHTLLPCTQVYVDPTYEDVQQMAYAGFDLPIDKDEAHKLYDHLSPQMAEAIETNAVVSSQPETIDQNTQFGQAYNRTFQHPVVTFRVFWLRHQPIPMDADEAIEEKLIEERQVPDEEAIAQQQAAALEAAANLGGETGEGEVSGTSGAQSVAMENEEALEEGERTHGSGMPAGDGELAESSEMADEEVAGAGRQASPPQTVPVPAPAISAPTRTACFLCNSDTELTPEHDSWPTRPGIRQIIVVANQVVDDRECEHPDFPLLQNRNIPVNGSPFGMGEPYRLMSLQRARSRMLGSISKHADYFGAPAVFVPRSTWDRMDEKARDKFHIEPGLVVILEDDIYKASNGKPMSIIDPPTTPPALIQGQAIFKEEMEDQSGHTPVLQGRTEQGVTAGKAIGFLQSAASSVISFKSGQTGAMVEHDAKLMLHSLVYRLSIDDMAKINSKYPSHILEAIRMRARRIEWDVSVTVSSGNGAIKSQKKQQALQDLEAGAITMETYREISGIDHRQEEQRAQAAIQKAGTAPAVQQAQQQQQGPQQKQGQPGQEKKPPSSQQPPQAA